MTDAQRLPSMIVYVYTGACKGTCICGVLLGVHVQQSIHVSAICGDLLSSVSW